MTAKDVFGPLDVPTVAPAVGESVGDPALLLILQYLQAFLNTYAAASWQVLFPGSPVVKGVYPHDPELTTFREADQPALYLFRDGSLDEADEQLADDYLVSHDRLRLIWVFPVGGQEAMRRRAPFSNVIARLVGDAVYRVRDPSWVADGDSDPTALTLGSNIMTAANLWVLKKRDHRVDPIRVRMADGTILDRTYEALRITLELQERLTLGGDAALTSITGTTQTADVPPLVHQTFRLDPPT